MKRNLLLFFLVIFPVFLYAQIPIKLSGAAEKARNPTAMHSEKPTKGGGDIIWESSFNWSNPADPQGWSLPAGWEIRDNSDLGNNWKWLQDSIKGRFTNEIAPAWFRTSQDGFIAVPMDFYNFRDGFATENPSDTYIMTPPINCTGRPSVIVKLSQYYRFCCENDNTGHLELLVTNDNGVHWATYDLSFGIGHNTFTPVKYRTPEFNISDVAAGMPNVRIKIYFHEVPYYFWAIDDLQLCEAYQNDLKLDDSWIETDGGFEVPIGHINYLPYTQIGMASESGGKVGDYSFRAALINNGMADAEDTRLSVKALLNGNPFFSQTSDAVTIWPLERDTLELAESLIPSEYGDYKLMLQTETSNGEDRPDDNQAVYYFTVNDSLFQRADMTAESAISTSVWANGNKAGDLLAVRYDIKSDVEINSITAKIQTFVPDLHPSFQFVLLKYSPEEDDYIEVLTSDAVPMDSTMLGYVTLPLSKDGESEFLKPGQYYAAWRAWADGEVPGMRLGWDQNARAEFTNHNLIYLTSIATWYSSDKLPILGLNFNQHGGPTQAPVTFQVDMRAQIGSGEFKPGSDFVDISGSFNNWGSS